MTVTASISLLVLCHGGCSSSFLQASRQVGVGADVSCGRSDKVKLVLWQSRVTAREDRSVLAVEYREIATGRPSTL